MYMILYILLLFVSAVVLLVLYGAFDIWKGHRIAASMQQRVGSNFPGFVNTEILQRVIHSLNILLDTIFNMSLKSICITVHNFFSKLDYLTIINIYLAVRLYVLIVPDLNFELLWAIL